jgi:hypothetical protein
MCQKMQCMQGAPGGKFSILGGHSTSHCKEESVYVHVLYSKTVDKKEILRTVSDTAIYCSSDKVGTVYLV